MAARLLVITSPEAELPAFSLFWDRKERSHSVQPIKKRPAEAGRWFHAQTDQ